MVHKITMDSYMKNPVGHGSASVARRDVIRRNLESRYLTLYRRHKKDFKVAGSYLDKDGNYLIHFKIPSEFYDLQYDVVLRFLVDDKSRIDTTLKNYQLQLFSNSPNFVYTYAYVYNKDGNVIPFLKNKISRIAFTQPPVVRNPNQSYGFEKSVYWAILYIRENPKVVNKANMNPEKLNAGTLASKIMKASAKQLEYNKAKKTKRDSEKDASTGKTVLSNTQKKIDNARSNLASHKTVKHQFKSIANSSQLNKSKRKAIGKTQRKSNAGKKVEFKAPTVSELQKKHNQSRKRKHR